MSIWACYKLCGHPDQTQTSQANTKLSDLVVLFYGNLEHLRIQYRYLDICLDIFNQYTFYLFRVVLFDIWYLINLCEKSDSSWNCQSQNPTSYCYSSIFKARIHDSSCTIWSSRLSKMQVRVVQTFYLKLTLKLSCDPRCILFARGRITSVCCSLLNCLIIISQIECGRNTEHPVSLN